MNYPHPIIAREGWPFIAIAAVVALLVQFFAGFGLAWLFWLLLAFVVQFFRDPARPIPTQANAVLCPADGRIVAVETAHDPYANREALKISVFMNVFNVHSQRSPVDGAISKVEYFPGAYLNAAVDKASTENERNAVVIQMAGGQTVTSVQIAGLIARRILCYAMDLSGLARASTCICRLAAVRVCRSARRFPRRPRSSLNYKAAPRRFSEWPHSNRVDPVTVDRCRVHSAVTSRS
jgi:phosphatidylserine decarboxylase